MFIKGSANSHGFVDADVTLKLWKKHFDYFYREEDWFVFPLTLHPDVSGRPHMLLLLEEFVISFRDPFVLCSFAVFSLTLLGLGSSSTSTVTKESNGSLSRFVASFRECKRISF